MRTGVAICYEVVYPWIPRAFTARGAQLLTTIYENGLGEFAYRNGLKLHGRIRFPVEGAAASPARPHAASDDARAAACFCAGRTGPCACLG